MTALKEKDVVNYIINNWNKFFPELAQGKKEFSFRESRVDILSSLPVNLKDLGLRDEDCHCGAAVFFEVKYNSNMRDLMYELQKLISFRDWYINVGKAFCMICVISDEYDYEMVKFMVDNNVVMYKINIEDDNLETMTMEEYTLRHKEIEESNEVVLN